MLILYIGFRNDGQSPSLICCGCIGTTYEEYLMVFIVLQRLVGIDVVISMMQVLIFCEFGLKMPTHAAMPSKCK